MSKDEVCFSVVSSWVGYQQEPVQECVCVELSQPGLHRSGATVHQLRRGGVTLHATCPPPGGGRGLCPDGVLAVVLGVVRVGCLVDTNDVG